MKVDDLVRVRSSKGWRSGVVRKILHHKFAEVLMFGNGKREQYHIGHLEVISALVCVYPYNCIQVPVGENDTSDHTCTGTGASTVQYYREYSTVIPVQYSNTEYY